MAASYKSQKVIKCLIIKKSIFELYSGEFDLSSLESHPELLSEIVVVSTVFQSQKFDSRIGFECITPHYINFFQIEHKIIYLETSNSLIILDIVAYGLVSSLE